MIKYLFSYSFIGMFSKLIKLFLLVLFLHNILNFQVSFFKVNMFQFSCIMRQCKTIGIMICCCEVILLVFSTLTLCAFFFRILLSWFVKCKTAVSQMFGKKLSICAEWTIAEDKQELHPVGLKFLLGNPIFLCVRVCWTQVCVQNPAGSRLLLCWFGFWW